MGNDLLPPAAAEFILLTNPIIAPYLADGDASFIERWFNLHVFALTGSGATDGDTIRVNPPKIRRPKESLSEEDSSSSEDGDENDKGGSDYKVEAEITQRATTSTRGRPLTRVSRSDKTTSTPTKGKAKEETIQDDDCECFDPSKHKKWVTAVDHPHIVVAFPNVPFVVQSLLWQISLLWTSPRQQQASQFDEMRSVLQ